MAGKHPNSETGVASIACRELAIPFHHVFRHASAARDKAATLWVEARGGDGGVGYGEGCPRAYVTGETVAGGLKFIEDRRTSIMAAVRDLETLGAWIAAHGAEIDRNPAAWCALELGLLDLFARRARVPVEDFLGVPRLRARFEYTAVIGVTSAEQCAALVGQYRQLGMTDYKIKLSGDPAADRANLEVLRAAHPARVRADANNLWSDIDTARRYLEALGMKFFAIEEPFEAGMYDAMSVLGAALDARIVLDESALRIDQLEHLSKDPARWIVNVRVSKMGGLLRALAFVLRCRAYGIPVIVGAQVGETSLLTRAALTVANAAGDKLIAQEGAFGTYLLESDPCEPELQFGAKGVLDVGAVGLPDLPGFGLRVRGA